MTGLKFCEFLSIFIIASQCVCQRLEENVQRGRSTCDVLVRIFGWGISLVNRLVRNILTQNGAETINRGGVTLPVLLSIVLKLLKLGTRTALGLQLCNINHPDIEQTSMGIYTVKTSEGKE